MRRALVLVLSVLTLGVTILPAHAQNTFSPPAGWPQGVEIPRLNVHAHVESDPLIQAKPIDQQPRWTDVLWWAHGPKPGMPGNAQIWGHLDSFCCPAVFWNLHLLRQGDVIRIYYRQGLPLTFRVMWTASYWDAHFPFHWLYTNKNTSPRGMVLITCSGAWHGTHGGYDHRLFVYARLILPNGQLG